MSIVVFVSASARVTSWLGEALKAGLFQCRESVRWERLIGGSTVVIVAVWDNVFVLVQCGRFACRVMASWVGGGGGDVGA